MLPSSSSSSLPARLQPGIRKGHLDARQGGCPRGGRVGRAWSNDGPRHTRSGLRQRRSTEAGRPVTGGDPAGCLLPGGGGRRLGRGAAFQGRRLPVGWTGSEREEEHFRWFTPRRTAALPRGGRRGDSTTGRIAAEPQARMVGGDSVGVAVQTDDKGLCASSSSLRAYGGRGPR